MVIMAILAVLATVFALSYASGCSAHQTDDEVKTPEPVVTAETVTTPAPEQSPVEPSAPPEETTEPARHRDDIVSEGRLLSYELQEVMQDCCEHYEVPYALVLAIAEVETHFDPDAVSATGDYGLMQINSVNHEWLLEKWCNGGFNSFGDAVATMVWKRPAAGKESAPPFTTATRTHHMSVAATRT